MTYFKDSRRNFLKTLTTTTLISGTSLSAFANLSTDKKDRRSFENNERDGNSESAPAFTDGPASPLFSPVDISGNLLAADLNDLQVSHEMAEAVNFAPQGNTVSWGIPFNISPRIICLKDKPYQFKVDPLSARWLVFLHTSDRSQPGREESGFYKKPFKGVGLLNESIADYIVIYEDGQELKLPVRQRYQIGMFRQIWGENCIEAVAHQKPRALNFYQQIGVDEWGWMQTRVASDDRGNWFNWLWAWENPDPLKKIMGLRFEPHNKSSIILSAITAGQVKTNPLRWNHRQKAILYPGTNSANSPEKIKSLSDRIKLDMGQVISAIPRVRYPEVTWPETYNNKVPDALADEIIIEFSAHPEARFHLEDKSQLQVSALSENSDDGRIRVIKPPDQRITIRVLDKSSGRDIPVKFHAHGESGEYLAPMNRHRYPNDAWFQDYGAEFVNSGLHNCTYIYGSTEIRLPKGKVYIEISKGFEIRPIRKIIEITPEAGTITIEVEKTLPWREKGWVTADTHVHFLSPKTALLEGEAEGVNIVNLLASQWGELMTNVGDFDGKTTFGVNEAGEGEYFVRVGTENRQHVLGHISLIGYEGNMILPLTIGGPDESAIGDPVEMLLTEWALQCKKQNGIVVLPHFPNPRLENASAIVSGGIDGVEMTSWGDLYSGISPYSLTDWYRYLNCGYFVAAVGGTDKMGADTPVGTVRTYAKIPDNQAFTYEVWKESIRKGHTFVTYGPLIDFTVDGKNSGSTIAMTSSGGTVNIEWEAASVTIPMSRVELVINGVIRESVAVEEWQASGNWNIKISASSWIALLIRGHHKDKPEIIVAHTSPVMITVGNTAMLAAADSLTILEQIEGAMAYLDTIGTRAEEKIYKRMKMSLTSAHRALHNRMHQAGIYHHHTPVNDHAEDKQ